MNKKIFFTFGNPLVQGDDIGYYIFKDFTKKGLKVYHLHTDALDLLSYTDEINEAEKVYLIDVFESSTIKDPVIKLPIKQLLNKVPINDSESRTVHQLDMIFDVALLFTSGLLPLNKFIFVGINLACEQPLSEILAFLLPILNED